MGLDPRIVAKAIAPYIEAIGWQPGKPDKKRHPRGVQGYQSKEGLVTHPPKDEDWFFYTLPSNKHYPERKGVLIELRDVKVVTVDDMVFAKEEIIDTKTLSEVGLDIDNRDGKSTQSDSFSKTIKNGQTEVEEIKNSISTTASLKGSYGAIEAELSTTIGHEWGKQTGRSEEDELSRNMSMDVLRGVHEKGFFQWKENKVKREIRGMTRITFKLRIGGGEIWEHEGRPVWWWHRRKHGVDYDNISDMIEVMKGRGNPHHFEYSWYFKDHKHIPPKHILDRCRKLPAIKMTTSAEYPKKFDLSIVRKTIEDVRTAKQKEIDEANGHG